MQPAQYSQMIPIKKTFVAAILSAAAAQFKEDFAEPQTTCPIGYDFNGKECTRVRFEAPRSQCPKGYEQQKDGCVATQLVRSEPICPEGYQMGPTGGKKGGSLQCIRSEIADAIASCPIGYEDTGSHCERHQKASMSVTRVPRISECHPEYECPSGSMNDGKQCVIEVNVAKIVRQELQTLPCEAVDSCPPGFNPSKGGVSSGKGGKGGKGDFICERIDSRPKLARQQTTIEECAAELSCPKGALSDGNSCIITQTTEKIIQTISHTEACEPAPICPPGSVDSGKGCEIKRSVPKLANPLKQTNRIPADYICSNGVEPDEYGNCPATRETEPITSLQMEIVPCDLDYTCPKGYTMEGDAKGGKGSFNCILHDSSPAIQVPQTVIQPCDYDQVCPTGSLEDKDGSCVIVNAVPYTTSYEDRIIDCPTYDTCPPGSQDLGNGVCVRQSQVPAEKDCQQIPVANKGNFDSDIKGGDFGFSNGGNGKNAPEIQYTLECAERCPKGTESLGKGLCGSQEQVPSITQCGTGCSQSGGKGKGKGGGQCTGTERIPIQTCPKGYDDTGKGCERQDVVPRLSQCPKGCTSSGGGKGKGKGDTGCFRTETTFSLECPKGYNLVEDAKSGGKGSSVCESDVATEPLAVCPKSCSRSSGKGKKGKGKGYVNEGCFRVETHSTSQCPKGFQEGPGKGGKLSCVSEYSIPANPYCPKGAQPTKDGMCVQESTQVEWSCPKGSEDVGKAGCLTVQAVPYQYVCPKDCQESHGKGKGKKGSFPECFTVEVSTTDICPKGYDDDGKVCSISRQVPATSFCPKDCTRSGGGKGKGKGGDGCFRMHHETIYECPKGFDDNGKECTSSITSLPLASCPKGCLPQGKGGVCVSNSFNTIEECPKGADDNGKGCSTVTYTSPFPVCPKGCTQRRGGKKGSKHGLQFQCFQTDYEEIETCPKGYEGGKGKGDGCNLVDTIGYFYDCPKGYTSVFDNEGHGKKSGGKITQCRRMDIAPADISCPKGTELIGGGSSKGGKIKGSAVHDGGFLCQSRDIVEPEYFCDKGGVMGDKGCEITDVADPIVTCPKGSNAKGGICA